MPEQRAGSRGPRVRCSANGHRQSLHAGGMGAGPKGLAHTRLSLSSAALQSGMSSGAESMASGRGSNQRPTAQAPSLEVNGPRPQGLQVREQWINGPRPVSSGSRDG